MAYVKGLLSVAHETVDPRESENEESVELKDTWLAISL